MYFPLLKNEARVRRGNIHLLVLALGVDVSPLLFDQMDWLEGR